MAKTIGQLTSATTIGNSDFFVIDQASQTKKVAASVVRGGLVNADVDAAAAIVYSKLNLSNSIVAGDLTADAVTTAKILDANVTTAKILDANVTTAKILDGNVTAAKLAAKVTFPNYAAGVTQNYNTLYQAATDGYLCVRATGSFVNGIQIVVGTTSSPTNEVWQAGDDINLNTKRAATMLPIPKDIYYKVQPLSGIAAFETVFVEWYPIIT